MDNRTDIHCDILQNDIGILNKASNNLKLTYEKVLKLDLSSDLTNEELELMDSFASRFMRLYEVLVNQVIKTVLIILRENKGALLDRLNTAEKLGLVNSTSDIDKIRITRNKVAHEYLDKDWKVIYRDLIDQTPILFECNKMVLEEVGRRGLLYTKPNN